MHELLFQAGRWFFWPAVCLGCVDGPWGRRWTWLKLVCRCPAWAAGATEDSSTASHTAWGAKASPSSSEVWRSTASEPSRSTCLSSPPTSWSFAFCVRRRRSCSWDSSPRRQCFTFRCGFITEALRIFIFCINIYICVFCCVSWMVEEIVQTKNKIRMSLFLHQCLVNGCRQNES